MKWCNVVTRVILGGADAARLPAEIPRNYSRNDVYHSCQCTSEQLLLELGLKPDMVVWERRKQGDTISLAPMRISGGDDELRTRHFRNSKGTRGIRIAAWCLINRKA